MVFATPRSISLKSFSKYLYAAAMTKIGKNLLTTWREK
jgi:hypothetical protein